MTIDIVALGLVIGLANGLLYALVAVGFSLIFGVAKILFLTHGELYMLGAMFAYYFIQKLGMGYVPAIILVMLITGVLGLIINRFLHRLRGQDLPTLIVTLAIAMLIANVALNTFGERSQVVTSTLWPGTISLLGIIFEGQRVAIVFVALAAVLALHFFIQRTKAGQAIRAIAQDREAALLQGISVSRSQAMTFLIACATAGLAGILVAPVYYVDVFLGGPVLMRTFIIVILGGLGSFPGAIVGGLFLGVIESLGSIFIGGHAMLLSFGAVILMLIIRPQGFLGRE